MDILTYVLAVNSKQFEELMKNAIEMLRQMMKEALLHPLQIAPSQDSRLKVLGA